LQGGRYAELRGETLTDDAGVLHRFQTAFQLFLEVCPPVETTLHRGFFEGARKERLSLRTGCVDRSK
jgi:hypothetical protein